MEQCSEERKSNIVEEQEEYAVQSLPKDIRFPEWLSVVRQMMSKARHQSGLAALTITVFVNQDGKPISWLPPVRTLIHPKKSCNEFLEFLEATNILKRRYSGSTLKNVS